MGEKKKALAIHYIAFYFYKNMNKSSLLAWQPVSFVLLMLANQK